MLKKIICYFKGHKWKVSEKDEFLYVCERCNKMVDTGF